MTTRTLMVALVLLGSWGGSSSAWAQETGVSGELERTARSTDAEKRRYAEDTSAEVQEALRQISRLLEGARRGGEASVVQCLQARQAAVRALLAVTEAAGGAMESALSEGRDERADHEFRKVAVARVKARELLAEAERCTDDSPLRSGETEVTVEGRPPGDESDLDSVEIDPFELGYDSPQASPYS